MHNGPPHLSVYVSQLMSIWLGRRRWFCRFRPRYGRGQEILVYKDAEHLHRSPRATSDPAGRAREAIWRFQ